MITSAAEPGEVDLVGQRFQPAKSWPNMSKQCHGVYLNKATIDWRAYIESTVPIPGTIHEIAVVQFWSIQFYSANYNYAACFVEFFTIGINESPSLYTYNLTLWFLEKWMKTN